LTVLTISYAMLEDVSISLVVYLTFCLVLQTELLDEYADAEKGSERIMLTDASHFDRGVIGFQNASFTWSNDDANDGALTPRRRFTLRVDGELIFKRGCFNLIVGPTGSGKTSLLMALLGEMHFIPMTPDAWYHLPRSGGVSYAAQESWVQNETIRVSPTCATVQTV
jgi:ABC-type multidrug transport system fused ATPase/permease subunit